MASEDWARRSPGRDRPPGGLIVSADAVNATDDLPTLVMAARVTQAALVGVVLGRLRDTADHLFRSTMRVTWRGW